MSRVADSPRRTSLLGNMLKFGWPASPNNVQNAHNQSPLNPNSQSPHHPHHPQSPQYAQYAQYPQQHQHVPGAQPAHPRQPQSQPLAPFDSQITPKAEVTPNPFDNPALTLTAPSPSPSLSPSVSSSAHPIPTSNTRSNHPTTSTAGNITPPTRKLRITPPHTPGSSPRSQQTGGDSTPTVAGIQPLAFPTTQLSLHPPQFNLKPVPPPGAKSSTTSSKSKTGLEMASSTGISGSSTPRGAYPPGVSSSPAPASSASSHDQPQIRALTPTLSAGTTETTSGLSGTSTPTQMGTSTTTGAGAGAGTTGTPTTGTGTPTGAKPTSHAPRGQLHVKLIQARGLNVKSSTSRPYVVVVYEQNEFISREPTHESEKEVKSRPNPLSRQSSSANVQGLQGKGTQAQVQSPVQSQPQPQAQSGLTLQLQSKTLSGSKGSIASKASSGAAAAAEIAKEVTEKEREKEQKEKELEGTAIHALKQFDIRPRGQGQLTPSDEKGPSSSRSSSGSSGGSKVVAAGTTTSATPTSTTGSLGATLGNVVSALRRSASGHSIHDAASPVWKHQVSFDVTSERSILSLNIYDRKYDGIEGYLGTVEIKPALVHDRAVDVWHKLESHGLADPSHPITGELRVQITYEQSQTKRSLTPRDFEVLKLIGKGTFGRVFQVRKKDTRRIYAMKVLNKKEIVAKKEVAHTIGERKILQRSLESPFLVGLKFSFQTDTELFLVTDFKSGGELFWHLQRETRFTEERARFYIAELTLALEHLHKHDIVYRDLKPENILLDATGHVALCDFGLSKPDLPANQLTNTFCGTTEYLAPEILLDDLGYSKMVDFWSLGVLLFEMLCGWSPFYNEDTQVMYRNICYGKIKFPRNTVSEDGKQFVKGLLNRVPANRLGSKGDAAELKAHPFFTGIDWVALLRKEVTPPFKPNVESDESTDCFDPEFTSADLKDVGVHYWDEDEAMMVDPATGQRLYNGPAGSERVVSQGAGAPEGAIDVLTPIGSYQAQQSISQAAGGTGAYGVYGAAGGSEPLQVTTTIPFRSSGKKRRSSSPISSSLQENFRGFSYTAAESVDDFGWEGGLRGRMREEDEGERMRERHQDAVVVDEEISISPEEMPDKMDISGTSLDANAVDAALKGEFGEANEAMRKMHIGASGY